MPSNHYCSHGLCKSNIRNNPNLKFARFPKLTIDRRRAEEWAIRMCRTDFTVNSITQNTVVCELHFPLNANLNYRENEHLVPYPHGHKRGERPQRERAPEVELPFPSGGFETAIKLKNEECMYAIISKEYTIPEWLDFAGNNNDLIPKIMVSSNDFDYLRSVLRSVPEIKYIHLPADHMFTQDFDNFVKKVRRNFPTHGISIGSAFKSVDKGKKSYAQGTKKVINVEIPVPRPCQAKESDIDAKPGNFWLITSRTGSTYPLPINPENELIHTNLRFLQMWESQRCHFL